VGGEIDNQHESVGAWAKRYYFANRAAIDAILRPHDLGSTQWYVLYELVNDGPMIQRDLAQLLHLERATLSGIVATLVGKGLIDQETDATDQRQRVLSITDGGRKLWQSLPDPIAVIRANSFQDSSDSDLDTAIRVLQAATRRLGDYTAESD
jgi:MarR family transcriptional regulator, lower aerobic nicotinate degradation pathway regulator